MEKSMEKIVALAKARGFVYPGSEIYGGLANTWDYGKSIQRWCRLCHSYESADMGSFRTFRRIFRPSYGL